MRSHCFLLPLCMTLVFGPVTGCITSSPAEYGVTPAAKKRVLTSCEHGMLDDGEDGDGQVIKVEGRDGYWFTFGDTEGTQFEPRGPFQMSPGGRPAGGGLPESQFSARVSGKMAPTGKSIYAGVGFALSNPKSGFDLSHAQGIQFWAKGPGKVRFKAPDINTDPAGDRCDDCYNDFGVDIYLSDEWERYTVLFEDMQQQPGWGDRAPYVASGAIMAIQWQFTTPGAAFDLAFDDVALVGCEAPSGQAVSKPGK
jgi:endoglucanase